MKLRNLCIGTALVLASSSVSYAAVSIASDSLNSSWTQMTYAGLGEYDYIQDEQATNSESDIVGNTNNSSFYTFYDTNGTLPTNDDVIGYRVRVAGDKKSDGQFGQVVFVGMDLDGDFALDVFAGVSFSGSTEIIGLFEAGNDLNNSPSTTSISGISSTYQNPAVDGDNFSFRAVTVADGGTTTDVDAGNPGKASGTDFYISFSMPYSDLAGFAADKGIAFGPDTPISYVLATATQDNSLNQDFNGLPKNFDGTTTWEEHGVLTEPKTVTGASVPEPSSVFLTGLAGLAFLFRRSRK
ncbi:PEP-CTERM protein-sorting domain-containing protein [Rubritalea squalenifaciens DSM 18772]|uniref:PEP-CTERM protein-sorting domain-containing protein n=1 Tax=Rubritalea squalenifaciens DSM 18772 TaxID=1123071 RepID=A0A1M6M098_9BACT|nr:PEP-CTERM sorting domain-containing protein [Rubritalea squalenifaciens]SHJ76939.1 PEP-CTERM protein-sorting domain-containing protein [Rubritalea squalenifaciens DSM 18772]